MSCFLVRGFAAMIFVGVCIEVFRHEHIMLANCCVFFWRSVAPFFLVFICGRRFCGFDFSLVSFVV